MWDDECKVANEIADRAAEIGMRFFRGEFEVHSKADRTPVTEADLAIEAMAREVLIERFPEDAIWGEEDGLIGESDRVWVIDPIDGTKNFADGIQIWASLIALRVDDVPVVGVVGAPALGERYEATVGGGATLNGEPIHVSDDDRLGSAFLAHGGLWDWLEGPRREAFLDVVGRVRRTRGIGDFWGHMLVARGAADIMLEVELRIWDTSAVQVVVEEAGGRMTTLEGNAVSDHSSVLSTNGPLHEAVVEIFRGN